MDLRSGHSFWLIKNGLLGVYPSLRQHQTSDVAIIGGGITGALIAYRFAQEGIDVVLVDKREVATGSTAASTALLQYEADLELVDLALKVGIANAVRSYRLGQEAIAKIERLVRDLGVDCAFERKSSLYLASANSHVKKLRQEYELRRQHDFDVEYLDASDIASSFPFRAHAAILASGDAQVDAFRLAHALLGAASRRGARIFDRTAIEHIEQRRDSFVLTTAAGFNVNSRHWYLPPATSRSVT